MRLAASKPRQSTGGEVECDLMRALAEIPPMKLAGVDEAFVLLDTGLGAVFSASMARRAAMHREPRPGSETSSPKDSPTSAGTGHRTGLLARLSLQKSTTDSWDGALRGADLMRKAVTRLNAPLRRLNAQKATMKMFDNFVDEEAIVRKRALSILPGADSSDEFAGDRGPMSPSSPRRWPLSPDGDSTWNEEHFRRATLSSQHRGSLTSRVSAAPALEPPLPDDPTLQAWALQHIGLPPERLQCADHARAVREKLLHQMLCWEAMRSSDLLLPGEPAARSPRGGSAGRPLEPAPALVAAAQSLFGLAGHLVSGTGERRPRAKAGPGKAAEGAGEAAGAPRAKPSLDPLASASHSSWLSVRDQAHLVASSRTARAEAARMASSDLFTSGGASPRLPLPRPPKFIEPHASLMSTDVCHTPEFLYLRRCSAAGLVPCQSAWRQFGGGVGCVDVRSRSLSNADIRVVVEAAIECVEHGYPWKSFYLGGNAITDDGLRDIARLLASKPSACTDLHTLSLAGNRQLRMRGEALLAELSRALGALCELRSLDLSGVALRGPGASSLAAALGTCPLLQRLSLADCGLGLTDQSECVAMAGLLAHTPSDGRAGIEIADFSGNYFNRAGFAAAAAALRKSRVRDLSFAGNGGGHWGAHDGGGASPSRESSSAASVRFHPAQLLLEGLQFNTTVEQFDMSGCGLGPDSAFVLEDALQSHPAIKSLLLVDNPLGDAGIRCIIRLLVSMASTVSTCNLCGHREADPAVHPVKFRHTQPGGMYTLDLRFPHERATFRTLLRCSSRLCGGTLRFFKFDPRQPRPSVERDAEANTWVVPCAGTHSFTFQPPLSEAAHKAAAAAAAAQSAQSAQPKGAAPGGGPEPEAPTRAARGTAGGPPPPRHTIWLVSPNLGPTSALHSRPPPEPDFFSRGKAAGLDKSFSRQGLRQAGGKADPLGAAGRAVGLKPGQPQPQLDDQQGEQVQIDWGEIACVLASARMPITALRFPLLRSMFLSLVTSDQQRRFVRACAKDLSFNAAQVARLCEDRPELSAEVICALFPGIRGRSAQLMLLGSASLPHARRVSQAVSPYLWFQEGNLTGRYRLSLAEPADSAVAENCLLVNAWESEVGRLAGRPDVSQRGNYEMLRNEEHNEVRFMYARDWNLPSHGWFHFDFSSIRRPPPTATTMAEATEVTRYLQKNSCGPAAKLKALRAISVHMYLSAMQFRNLALCFPEGELRQDLFCVLHTRVVDPAHLLGPMVLYANHVFRPEDREAIFRRVGHLHLLNPLHPDKVPYCCRLNIYEERRVVEFLVQLTVNEAGGKVIKEGDESHLALPASWADKGVPSEDVLIACIYETPSAASVNLPWRHYLAERYTVGVFNTEK